MAPWTVAVARDRRHPPPRHPDAQLRQPPLPRARRSVSVTANTRRDGEEFLALAAEIPIRPTTTEYPFEKAAVALEDLARDAVNGAAVIRVSGGR